MTLRAERAGGRGSAAPAVFSHKKEIGGVHMGTILVLAVLAAAVGFVIRGMIRDKKNGKSLQCGGDCSHCGGHCH